MKIVAGKYTGSEIQMKKQRLYMDVPHPDFAAQQARYERALRAYTSRLTLEQRESNDKGENTKTIGKLFGLVFLSSWVFAFADEMGGANLEWYTWWMWLSTGVVALIAFIIGGSLTAPGAPEAPTDTTIVMPLDATTIASTEEINEHSRQDFWSSYAKSFWGGKLLGGAGQLAGAMSGNTVSTHLVAITWKDGERSLAEVDGAAYRLLLQVTFK